MGESYKMSSARASADMKKDIHSPATTQKSGEAQSEGSSRGGTPEADDAPSDSNAKPNVPMQKRRRVTRACDECRRKKIKCDGKQPCTHCTVYSYGESEADSSRSYRLIVHRVYVRPAIK
jgi:hypothetical protein